MNKKVLKLFAASSVALMFTAPVIPVVENAPIVSAATLKQKTAKMSVYKYSKNHKSHAKSMAQGFIGNKVQLTIKGKKVTKMTIHVDGNNSPMGKGQDVDKIVRSLKVNGVSGQKENVSADHSSFDFVFSGKAFKNNGWVKMNVTIDFGGKMTEQAWIKFNKVSGVSTTQKKHKKSVKKAKSHKKVSKKSHKSHRR